MGMTFDEAKQRDDIAQTLAELELVGKELHERLHELEEAKQRECEARSAEVLALNRANATQKRYDELSSRLRELGGKNGTDWGRCR